MSATSELSRPVDVESLPQTGRTVRLDANETERAAVATRLGLVALDAFVGEITVKPAIGREIVADGSIRADIVQTCVVTGQSIATTLTFDLQRRYTEDTGALDGLDADDDEITDPNDDGPDPIVDGVIDVGEASVEELALQIPPYPRTPGAEFSEYSTGSGDQAPPASPFAALAELKNKLESKD